MTEEVASPGRTLNATFLPSTLLRKNENKLATSLTSKCKSPPTQINFKKPPAIPSSQSTLLKSSFRATNSTKVTQLQFA